MCQPSAISHLPTHSPKVLDVLQRIRRERGCMCATNSADMQHPLFSLCVKESGAVHYVCFNALRGLWAEFVLLRVNSSVRAVSSFSLGVLPAFWPQRGVCRGIDRWQYAFGSRLVQIGLAQLHKAAGSPLLAGCCIVWSFSQTQSDVLRRFRFMGVIWQPNADSH